MIFFFDVDYLKKLLFNLLKVFFFFFFFFLLVWCFDLEVAPQPGMEPTPLHWKVKSSPLEPQGRPTFEFLNVTLHLVSIRWVLASLPLYSRGHSVQWSSGADPTCS